MVVPPSKTKRKQGLDKRYAAIGALLLATTLYCLVSSSSAVEDYSMQRLLTQIPSKEIIVGSASADIRRMATLDSMDAILLDSTFYETHDIRSATETDEDNANKLLGHYWFPTEDLLRQTTGPAAASRTNNIQNKQKQPMPWNDHQKQLLNDLAIIPHVERNRCERYGLPYDPARTERRRIFFGATLADDSFFLLQTIATEGYNLYHTASFVESNTTHTRSRRELRFPPNSDNLKLLQSMFGNQTTVSVEYFAPLDKTEVEDHWENGIGRFDWQFVQRQGILERWKRNGMRPDDIGLLADADEMFSRDFLRALQICDVPELRPGQTCEHPKIVATTLVYEASPECIVSNGKIWHPSAILGECLEGIGDSTIHKPPKRAFHGSHSGRATGYGEPPFNYSAFFKEYPDVKTNDPTTTMYSLWNAADFRTLAGGRQMQLDEKKVSHNAFHFHNFFESSETIRHKYTTYGEPIPEAAKSPLGVLHDDLSLAVSCAHGWQNFGDRKYYVGGDQEAFPASVVEGEDAPHRPIFFEQEAIRSKRHQDFKDIIRIDEERFGIGNATCASLSCSLHKR